MLKIFASILFGYLLIALEAIVPGGILGLLGFICLLASSYFVHLEFGGWILPALVFLAGCLGGVLLMFFQFKLLSRSKLGKDLFVHSTSGRMDEARHLELVGKRGIARTDHHPEGIIRVEGKDYDACISDGFAPQGVELEVAKAEPFRLIVRRV